MVASGKDEKDGKDGGSATGRRAGRGSDRTAALLGAAVVQREWPGLYAKQFNWALDNLPIEGEWILRMDADA